MSHSNKNVDHQYHAMHMIFMQCGMRRLTTITKSEERSDDDA